MNNSKSIRIFVLGVLALVMVASGCKTKTTPPPPPPPPKAPTATLSANPASIQRGQSATLTWSTENATDVAMDGNKVDASGSQTVSPTQTTTYHLTAKGSGGTQEATAQVSVAAPPPPAATPAPTPNVTDEQLFAQMVKDVYFDYDKAELRADAQQSLAQAAQLIKQKGWKVQIEGNCDERGSTEFNLSLGEHRADSARQALIQNGVSADSVKTISYGKEKPQCSESNEECWQKNRRDHFTLLH
ncbi:MAG TPA: peptidoglycan-associated lipoprotein Pal [Candidatus Angelobacter sp.]